jgi:hypothetical protein
MMDGMLAIVMNNFWLFAIALAAAAFFVWLIVKGVRTGEMRSLAWASPGPFRRDRSPVMFWFVALTYAIVAIVIAATPFYGVWHALHPGS